MKVINYNKLIRDKIPEIIKSCGKKAIVEKVSEDELLNYLNEKLEEELNEYKESGAIEELADLIEVVYAILDCKGITSEEFDDIRSTKNKERGKFKEGLVLLKVIEDDSYDSR